DDAGPGGDHVGRRRLLLVGAVERPRRRGRRRAGAPGEEREREERGGAAQAHDPALTRASARARPSGRVKTMTLSSGCTTLSPVGTSTRPPPSWRMIAPRSTPRGTATS